MADFQLPTARKPAKGRTPPEVEELVLLLQTAVEVIPEVAPVLALGAVTGMRRGELLGLRRSRLQVEACRLVVDAAIDEGSRVKTTKTRVERTFHVDAETMAMLVAHCQEMEERARSMRAELVDDPFVFSLTIDCSQPIPPDYLTRRVGVLKEHLGHRRQAPRNDRPGRRSPPPVPRGASKPGGQDRPSPQGRHVPRRDRQAVGPKRPLGRRSAAPQPSAERSQQPRDEATRSTARSWR